MVSMRLDIEEKHRFYQRRVEKALWRCETLLKKWMSWELQWLNVSVSFIDASVTDTQAKREFIFSLKYIFHLIIYLLSWWNKRNFMRFFFRSRSIHKKKTKKKVVNIALANLRQPEANRAMYVECGPYRLFHKIFSADKKLIKWKKFTAKSSYLACGDIQSLSLFVHQRASEMLMR